MKNKNCIQSGLIKCSLIILLFMPHIVWAEVVDISINELQTMIESENSVLIDVRTPKEWHQTGIVEGSIPIMFFDEKRRPRVQEWMSQAAPYIAPERDLILICRSGNRSKIIANYLIQQHGYTRVYNVKAGIKQWLRLGHKTVVP